MVWVSFPHLVIMAHKQREEREIRLVRKIDLRKKRSDLMRKVLGCTVQPFGGRVEKVLSLDLGAIPVTTRCTAPVVT